MGQGKTANFDKIFEKCQICTLLNVTEPFEIISQAALKVHLASVHGFNGQNGKISDPVFGHFVISSKHAGKSFCFHPSL